MNRLASFLQARLGGMPLKEAADRTGIQDSTLGRIKSGQAGPSFENVLRIARFLRVHPAHLYELQGEAESAFLYRSLFPEVPDEAKPTACDLYPAPDVGCHERLQRLLEMGLRRQVEAALNQVESALSILEAVFVQTVRAADAKAAVLVVDFPERTGEILFRWHCREPTATTLAEKRAMRGWQPFVERHSSLVATLFLKGVEDLKRVGQISGSLRAWASALSSVIEGGERDRAD